jgi:glycerophosphoryl diester phosphodiesterase
VGPRVLEHVRALDPGTAIGSSLGDIVAFFEAFRDAEIDNHRPRGEALQIPTHFMGEALVTPESVDAAHRAGLRVHVWTVNETEEMVRLLDCGVDGLMSDDPETLVRVARERAGEP